VTPIDPVQTPFALGEVEPAIVAAIFAAITMLDEPVPRHDAAVWMASARVAPAWRMPSERTWRDRERLRGWDH
jgi:hypothetical protein